MLSSSNYKIQQLSDIIREKDKIIDSKNKVIDTKDSAIKQRDQQIAHLEQQLKEAVKSKNALQALPAEVGSKPEHKSTVIKEQIKLRSIEPDIDPEKDNQIIAREFFVRFASFLVKKNLTLYGVVHHKIYDKVFNGVELELIRAEYFWRFLHKVGFNTIAKERDVVTSLCKHSSSCAAPLRKNKGDDDRKVYTEIFDVKSLLKILSQLGV